MRLIVSALLVLVATNAFAEDDEYRACINKSEGSNPDFAICGGEMLDRVDKRLNEAWKEAYQKLTEASKKVLLDEQRAWNAFKEKSCLLYSTGDFGRLGQVWAFHTCREGVIEERIKFLKSLERWP
jgi:uncharacterized protein YecT (DUF1311 family)